MKNLREINDDILKDWFIYRDEDISALKSDEDKKHWIYFDEISERILGNVPVRIKSMLENSWKSLMIIFLIILVIGMRNTIGMDLLMACS